MLKSTARLTLFLFFFFLLFFIFSDATDGGLDGTIRNSSPKSGIDEEITTLSSGNQALLEAEKAAKRLSPSSRTKSPGSRSRSPSKVGLSTSSADSGTVKDEDHQDR